MKYVKVKRDALEHLLKRLYAEAEQLERMRSHMVASAPAQERSNVDAEFKKALEQNEYDTKALGGVVMKWVKIKAGEYRTEDDKYTVVKDPTSGNVCGSGWGYTSWLIYEGKDGEPCTDPVSSLKLAKQWVRDRVFHDVRIDYCGFNQDRQRFTCHKRGCEGATIVVQPGETHADWRARYEEYSKKHPNELIKSVRRKEP